MKKYKVIIFILLIIVLGCESNKTNSKNIDGYWETEGYGYLFNVESGKICNLYETTSISNIELFYDDINEEYEIELLENGKLKITDFYSTFYANKRTDIIEIESNYDKNDPIYNFEVFWNTFNEHYAFMEHKNINWQETYDKNKLLVTEDTTNYELFSIMTEMLTPLADSHVNLFIPETKWWSHPEGEIENYLKNSFLSDLLSITENYILDNNEFIETGNGKILYGKMNNDTGYMCLLGSQGFGDGSLEYDLEELNNALDLMVDYFDGLETIIIDNRYNQGGYDECMLAVANRFTDDEVFAYSKKAKNNDSYTSKINKYIEPSDMKNFNNKNIKVLTSPITVSAGEILVLAIRALNNSEIIGMDTKGCLSDLLFKELPNGWGITLSNEIYESHDNKIFENKGELGKGIIPDIYVDLDIDSFLNDKKDSILTTALGI